MTVSPSPGPVSSAVASSLCIGLVWLSGGFELLTPLVDGMLEAVLDPDGSAFEAVAGECTCLDVIKAARCFPLGEGVSV